MAVGDTNTAPETDPNALAAGWHPEDGKAPLEHGAYVEPLDSDTDLAALKARIAAKGASS